MKPSNHVTQEASWSMKVITERSQCGQVQCSGVSPKTSPSLGSSRDTVLNSIKELPGFAGGAGAGTKRPSLAAAAAAARVAQACPGRADARPSRREATARP
eukprot:CAMPEP_0204572730 /NCGR_PEP_ID=MMETSP0661-20131031/39624_1 /ASSEMBLY_ACC=CAM_ASM_000606 /TAXON_ID=109239 /ORGANISM="Alexandrium margalefi, Strain AMGDE01CS-322" /LENGTH=100 /DNA_ID=CAMNT_0051581099 /DNA_START=91 /DNA_END=391 /DNA_ORIENTATION=+